MASGGWRSENGVSNGFNSSVLNCSGLGLCTRGLGKKHLQYLTSDLLKGDAAADTDDLTITKNMDIATVSRIIRADSLHLDICLILHIALVRLNQAKGAPAMINVDVVIKVQAVAAIHDEACDVAQTVAAIRVERKSVLAGWHEDLASSFEAFTVKPDLFDALESRPVLHRVGKDLVQETTSHHMSSSITSTFDKLRNTSLDEVSMALPAFTMRTWVLNRYIADCVESGLLPARIDAEDAD